MVQLKPIEDQVIVITGASSGIGLVTARMAARQGARLVLVARNGEVLRHVCREIQGLGGRAECVEADVANEEQMRAVVETADRCFGGIDTWINNAGVSIYGKLDQIPLEDQKRLFETNLWGVVIGSRLAAEALRRRGGGAIINIGSTVSDRAIPMQGIYSASKHAVKGFTDALRMELEEEGAPISVTLIKPGAINTPYTQHAKNYMDVEPAFPPPVYDPELVAEAILFVAQHPRRDVFIGGGGKALSALGQWAPRLMDKVMEWGMVDAQKGERPNPTPGGADSSLHKPGEDGQERGTHKGHVAHTSLYTKASLHPVMSGAAMLIGAGLALAAFMKSKTKPSATAASIAKPVEAAKQVATRLKEYLT